MKSFDLLAPDVDIKELAAETKNYSGAELEGLVRAAQSTAMNRHIKVTWHFPIHKASIRVGLRCYCGVKPTNTKSVPTEK